MSRFGLLTNTVTMQAEATSTECEPQMFTPLTFVGDESALYEALRTGHPGAAAAFYDRHADHVQRTLRSALGPDADLPDLLQEVFIRALDQIGKLNDTERVRSWLGTIATFVARAHLRLRARRRWLGLFSPETTRPQHLDPPSSEARWALREIYEVLDHMPLKERMAFVSRFIDGKTLPEAAKACQTSRATFKRRLTRAERQFLDGARKRPALVPWLQDGTRWNIQRQG
jgi:RNA polymerase sigma-70 factor (ECF subfamily)